MNSGKPNLLWQSWHHDPVAESAGISFDRTPADKILAPAGQIRVCAYHYDFDERPTVFVDVESLAEAEEICQQLDQYRGDWNVDFATAFDHSGKVVAGGPPWDTKEKS